MKPVIIIAIAFVWLIPLNVFGAHQIMTLSDTGIDIFTDKVHYEIGDTVKIGMRADSEKFGETATITVRFWDGIHDSKSVQFNVITTETLYHEYTLDDSWIGEAKIYAISSVDQRKWWDEYFFFVGIPNPTDDDFYQQRMHGTDGHWSNQETNPAGYYIFNTLNDPNAKSDAEIQAREEIENPCSKIPDPERNVSGDMNDPVFMDAFREAQYQYNQQIQHCLREYQILIDQRVAELQCGDFKFGKYTPIVDYDLVHDLILNGLSERNLDTSEVLVQYKGTIQYENECQSFYKEYQQLTNHVLIQEVILMGKNIAI